MEPVATAYVLLGAAALLVLAALGTRLSGRFGVPSLLIILAIGLFARHQPWFAVPRLEVATTFRLGSAALVLILFDGGLNTSLKGARLVALPAGVLATVGVLLTAAVVAGSAVLLGLAWPLALLTGAVVSSTDAAAVFSVLRASHARLREKVGLTLELESGLNDPMAVFLTVAVTDALAGGGLHGGELAVALVRQVGTGLVGGIATGLGGRLLLSRAHLPATGLYPVLTVAFAFFAFGATTLADGSGFLAVYLAAMLLGAGRLPFRASLLRVHDALAWISQIAMFLALGLAVSVDAIARVALVGTVLALVLAFFARPLAVGASLLPFRFTFRERLFVALVGLRGAVPIVLATIPLMRGVPGAERLAELVFAIVLVTSLVPGAFAGRLAHALRMQSPRAPPPPAGLEMVSRYEYDGDFVSYYVSDASAVAGAKVKELPLPEGCLVTLVVRDHEMLAPRGETELRKGDHVYVFARSADRPLADLLFGQAEE